MFKDYIKSAGRNQFQSVHYSNGEDIAWVFQNWSLDNEKKMLSKAKEWTFANNKFEEGNSHLSKFRSDSTYIVSE